MNNTNATITYEFIRGEKLRQKKEVRGRVTAKRIIIPSVIWDRDGNRISKSSGMYGFKLLSVEFDDGTTTNFI